MSDELKEKIILRIIKDYKNRLEWADEYVRNNYAEAIEYIKENFDRFNKLSIDGAISSKTQGDRSVSYKDISNIIQSDFILSSLVGLPLLRMY